MKKPQQSNRGHTGKHPAKGAGGKHHPAHKGSGKRHTAKAPKASASKHHQASKHQPPPPKMHATPIQGGLSPGAVAACTAEALAASLRLAGGRAADADVLELFWRAGGDPDRGATLEQILAAAADHGLAGIRPVSFRPAEVLADGVVLQFALPGGQHAATLDGHGLRTWGEWRPASCALLESAGQAWEITWP